MVVEEAEEVVEPVELEECVREVLDVVAEETPDGGMPIVVTPSTMLVSMPKGSLCEVVAVDFPSFTEVDELPLKGNEVGPAIR